MQDIERIQALVDIAKDKEGKVKGTVSKEEKEGSAKDNVQVDDGAM